MSETPTPSSPDILRELELLRDDKNIRQILLESKYAFKSPVDCHLESHNDLLFNKLSQIMKEGPAMQIDTENSGVRHKIYRTSARVGPPVAMNHKATLAPTYPSDCQVRGNTYSGRVFATTVHEMYDIRDLKSGVPPILRYRKIHEDVCYGNLPIMAKSALCRLSTTPHLAHGCPLSHGGEFYINGKTRIFIGQRSLAPNRALVFKSTKSATGTTNVGSAATASSLTLADNLTYRAPAIQMSRLESCHSSTTNSPATALNSGGMSTPTTPRSVTRNGTATPTSGSDPSHSINGSSSSNNSSHDNRSINVPYCFDLLNLELRSQHHDKIRSTATLVMNLNRHGDCNIHLPFQKCPIPPAALFRVLGVRTIHEMIQYILPSPWNNIPSLYETTVIALCRYLGFETTVDQQELYTSPDVTLGELEGKCTFTDKTQPADLPDKLKSSVERIHTLCGSKAKALEAGKILSLLRAREHVLIWIAERGGGSSKRKGPAVGVNRAPPKDDTVTRVRNLTHIFVNEFIPHVSQGAKLDIAQQHGWWLSTAPSPTSSTISASGAVAPIFVGISMDDEATLERKRNSLGNCLRKLFAVSCGLMGPDDPKHVANERVDLNGQTIALYSRQQLREAQKQFQQAIRHYDTNGKQINLREIIEELNPLSAVHRGFSSGNFGSSAKSLAGKNLAMVVGPNSGPGRIGLMARMTSIINTKGNSLAQRQAHLSEHNVICPTDTPEGHVCGVIRAQTLGTYIRLGHDVFPIVLMAVRAKLLDPLRKAHCEVMDPMPDDSPLKRCMDTEVYANGILVGRTRTPCALVDWLRERRGHSIPFDTEIVHIFHYLQIQLWTDAGAFMYPVFNLAKMSRFGHILKQVDAQVTESLWRELVEQGVIVYIGKDEETNYRIAELPSDVIRQKEVIQSGPPTVAVPSSGATATTAETPPPPPKPSLKDMQSHYEWVDAQEPFTHLVVDAAYMQSPFTSQQPFADHNHGARNTLQSAMGKQAIGLSTLQPMGWNRAAEYFQSFYPQRPLTKTIATRPLTKDILTSTMVAFVLVTPDEGRTVEDAIRMRKGFHEAGTAHSYTLHKCFAKESPANTANDVVVFGKPIMGKCIGMQESDRYDHLDEDGFPAIGTRIQPGDALVGMILTSNVDPSSILAAGASIDEEDIEDDDEEEEEEAVVEETAMTDVSSAETTTATSTKATKNSGAKKTAVRSRTRGSGIVAATATKKRKTTARKKVTKKRVTVLRDASLFHKDNLPCVVTHVLVTVDREECRTVVVTLRTINVPAIGDKFVMQHGQKGVNSGLQLDIDMPFTYGNTALGEPPIIIPDIKMNPHMWISRMTGGLSFEMCASLLAVLCGRTADATLFQSASAGRKLTDKALIEMIADMGLAPMNDRVWYDGRTGEQIRAPMFGGYVSDQRLQHLAENKEHARGTGPLHPNEGQPTEGKIRTGGLKQGEMELLGLNGHGMAATSKQTLAEKSALEQVYLCERCGYIAQSGRPGGASHQFTGMVLRGAFPYCTHCKRSDAIVSRTWNHISNVLSQEVQGLSGIWKMDMGGRKHKKSAANVTVTKNSSSSSIAISNAYNSNHNGTKRQKLSSHSQSHGLSHVASSPSSDALVPYSPSQSLQCNDGTTHILSHESTLPSPSSNSKRNVHTAQGGRKRQKLAEVQDNSLPPDYLYASTRSIPVGATMSLAALEEEMWATDSEEKFAAWNSVEEEKARHYQTRRQRYTTLPESSRSPAYHGIDHDECEQDDVSYHPSTSPKYPGGTRHRYPSPSPRKRPTSPAYSTFSATTSSPRYQPTSPAYNTFEASGESPRYKPSSPCYQTSSPAYTTFSAPTESPRYQPSSLAYNTLEATGESPRYEPSSPCYQTSSSLPPLKKGPHTLQIPQDDSPRYQPTSPLPAPQ